MSVLLKDPDASLDYSVDWTTYLESGETIVASAWYIEPGNELAVSGSTFSTQVATATLSDGFTGHVYRISNRVTTSAGRVDDRSFTIRVEQQ